MFSFQHTPYSRAPAPGAPPLPPTLLRLGLWYSPLPAPAGPLRLSWIHVGQWPEDWCDPAVPERLNALLQQCYAHLGRGPSPHMVVDFVYSVEKSGCINYHGFYALVATAGSAHELVTTLRGAVIASGGSWWLATTPYAKAQLADHCNALRHLPTSKRHGVLQGMPAKPLSLSVLEPRHITPLMCSKAERLL